MTSRPNSSTSQLQTLFYEQVFTNSHLGIILLDQEGHIVRITRTAAKILGGDKQELLGKNLFRLYGHLTEDRRLVSRRILNGSVKRNKVMTWYNGENYYEVLIDGFPLFDQDGKQQGAYIFIKDVTSVRSLENQIRRSEQLAMIGQMAAGTAHEIRNPLTSIRGFLQILNKTLGEHGLTKEVEYTAVMLDEIDRINQLVDEFLLLSKTREIRLEKLDLGKLIIQFLPIIKNDALLHGIELHMDHFEGLPTVMGDREMLKQVFLNICKNAIEAMGRKGKLFLSHRIIPEEQLISVDIRDTGPGIPPYVIDKIFEPFFTTKEEGTGLGLSVCQRIIHDMGGKIQVSAKGYGTTFHIKIPYEEE